MSGKEWKHGVYAVVTMYGKHLTSCGREWYLSVEGCDNRLLVQVPELSNLSQEARRHLAIPHTTGTTTTVDSI